MSWHTKLALALAVSLAVSIPAWAEEISKEGAIKLEPNPFGRDAKQRNAIALGEKVTFDISAYLDEFFNEPIINANAKIKNTTQEPRHAVYVITFYDADGAVIGVHAANWTLNPGEEVNYGSALIKGKAERFAKVTKYRVYACSHDTVAKETPGVGKPAPVKPAVKSKPGVKPARP